MIHVGDSWVEVPPHYIRAESEYTKKETDEFISLWGTPKEEKARRAVLEKRIEFYKLFKAGLVTINEPVQPVSWFTKIIIKMRRRLCTLIPELRSSKNGSRG